MHITYANDPIYFKSSLHSSQYLIKCKCYVNSCCIELFRGWWQGKFMYIFNAWFFSTLKKDLFTYLCVCLSVSICAWGGACMCTRKPDDYITLSLFSPWIWGFGFLFLLLLEQGLQAFSEMPCLLSGCWASLLSHFSSPILINNSFLPLLFWDEVLVLSLGWSCTHHVDSSDGQRTATSLPQSLSCWNYKHVTSMYHHTWSKHFQIHLLFLLF